MQEETEKRQIEDSKKDPQCFEPLYTKYYEQILKFVYKRVESVDDCREVTAIVFSKALSNIAKYKHLGFPFSSWLYRISINEITQFYRDSSRIRIISIDNTGITNIVEETGEQSREMIAQLKKALLYLTADELMLIELRFFEFRAFSEIGHILDITENNAKVRTYRVIDKLKDIYHKLNKH